MARTGVVRAIVPRTLIHVTTAVPATPEAITADEEHTHLGMAIQRIIAEGCPIDPQSAVAPFNSAF